MKRFTATLLLSAFLILVLSCGSKHTKGNTGEKVENRDGTLFEPIQLTFGPKQHWFGYYDKQQMGSNRKIWAWKWIPFSVRRPVMIR